MKVAAYTRISHEDNLKAAGENSNSIENQIKVIEEFCRKNNLGEISYYKDDGYSGTLFKRPELDRMFNDIESRKINCVVVKDLSRLGRDYLMTGYLIEKYFPENDVRFIAINDDVDTAGALSELLPFKNLFNDWYARDVSQKIRTAKYVKAREGKRLSSIAPYGYMADTSDKSYRLFVDEERAKIVRLIFGLYAEGEKVAAIIDKLQQQRVYTPSFSRKYGKVYGSENENIEHFIWSRKTIFDILNREEYIGNTINLKRRRISYRNHKEVSNNAQCVLTFYNTHEAIIDNDVWRRVHDRITEGGR